MNQDILNAKKETVSEVSNLLKENQALLIVEYRGLTVAELTSLRKSLSASESSLTVYKNTLVKRALNEANITDLDSYLEGPNAFVFAKDVSVGPKVVTKFAKTNENLVIKGGLVDGKAYNGDEMVAIAKLPDKNGLIAMLLSVLQAPVRQFAATVKAVGEAKN